jgi:fimbrial isopeptide formation D2 family protein
MEFKQKAEEKKMSMSKNIARLAVTAGLTAALSFGGVMAPVTMAFAEGSTVTFEDSTYSSSTTYKGIQIFTADVNGSTVKNIKWAGSDAQQQAIQEAVVGAINEWSKANNKGAYSSNNAQDAADWLNENAGVASADSKVPSDNVLSMIAANLDGKTGWVTSNNASLSGLDAGYWLFLTAAAGKPDGESTDAFTSPVYAVIDGTSTTTVKPKKSVPTVEKKILDDSNAKNDLTTVRVKDWKDVADSQIGQVVNYKLTGTIASNYATFSTYAYKFTDSLSNGLDYVNDSVEVYAFDGINYTPINSEKYVVTCSGNKLTVEFKVGDGKKGLKDVNGVTANTQIVVFYKAKLNGSAVIGNAAGNNKGGNPNTVKLTYSNNPYGDGTGETIEDTVADFAFKLNLNKVDQGTEKGLQGAVFTIQSADGNTKDKYIASKPDTTAGVVAGQLVTVTDANNLPGYVKFTSDKDGKISVSGLDAGSYTVTEVQTPDDTKYTKVNPFTFTITSDYDKTMMKVARLTAAVSPADEGRSDIAFGKLDGIAGDNELKGTDDAAVNAATGEVTINVGNTKSVGLPLTGLNGVTFTWIAGGAVLVIGVAHLIRSRKQAEESEQE